MLSEEDLECPLCCDLFVDPTSLPCGHSFCTECILRAFDSNTACPMCREVAHLPPQPAINHTLAALVDKFFHAQLTKRKSESVHLSDSQNFIPLFLLTTCLFPCESMQLHVFEPRYRLMVRRVLNGSRKLGILMPRSTTNPAVEVGDVGTVAHITSYVAHPDGRFNISVMGESRFKILHDVRNIDGYFVATFAPYNDRKRVDVPLSESGSPSPSLEKLLESASQSLKEYESNIRFYPGRRRPVAQPFADDVPTRSFQMAARFNLPPRLLRTKSTYKRLQYMSELRRPLYPEWLTHALLLFLVAFIVGILFNRT